MMNRRWWLVGAGLLLILAAYWWKGNSDKSPLETTNSSENVIQERADEFLQERGITLPIDVDRMDLADVRGGEGTGVATRKDLNGRWEYTILASLTDLTDGWYQAWLVSGETTVSLGNLDIAKGGYLVETRITQGGGDWKKVIVTLEKNRDDKPETTVLEGTF